MTSKSKPVIGITTGDPKGIGPEVVSKALSDPEIQSLAQFKIYGPAVSDFQLPDIHSAQTAISSLEAALSDALNKKIDALVTAPVNKARLRLVDKNFVGHTEFFASRVNATVCMMFVAKNLRVSLVTRHLPLSQVASRLNAVEILQTIRLTYEGLQQYFHILSPYLAVAGLNPHAGEGGMLGDEETRIIHPALVQARKEGIHVDGPISPDTLFWEASQSKWDGVIAMYHDQGLIPVKTLAFKEAVQITLGLPFLRVSVDHGTAENIVGTGRADATNLKAAIRLACRLKN